MTEPRVTYPASLIPSALEDGEGYASVRDILECDDLPQATLHIPHWRIRGRAAAIRVRGLTLEEKERVQALSGIANQYCRIWQYGCVQPLFTQEQAEALRRKNPQAVEQGAQFMLLLSDLNQEWIEHVVNEQTAPDQASDTGAAPQAPLGAETQPGSQADPAEPVRIKRVA